jgi:hypothetical protein|nr:MAG TPA: hypothetical protein [Caudoviricetes sp.]
MLMYIEYINQSRRNEMHKALNGKGYIRNGEGVFVTTAGEVYAYHEGELTPLTTTDHPKAYAELEGGRAAID